MSAKDPAYAWHKNAERHLSECPLPYNYVNTFTRLLECDLIIYRNALYSHDMPYNNDENKGKDKRNAYKKVKEQFYLNLELKILLKTFELQHQIWNNELDKNLR